MADFSQKELNPANINNGRRYIPGDGLTSEAVNLLVEAILYVQQHSGGGGGSGSLSLEDILNLLSRAEEIVVGDTTITRHNIITDWLATDEVYIGENDDVVIEADGINAPHIKAKTAEFGEDFEFTVDKSGTAHIYEAVVAAEIGVCDRAVVINDAGVSAPNVKTNTAKFGRNSQTTIDEYGTLTVPDIATDEVFVGDNDEVIINSNGIYLAEGASLHIGGEDALEDKLDKIPLSQASGTIAYTRDHLGNESYRGVSASPITAGGSIPVYNRSSAGHGILKTSTPEAIEDCVNLAYADMNYGPITVSVEDQMTAWDDGDNFSIEDAYFYTIHTFATYIYQGNTHAINFKPVSLLTDFKSTIKAEANILNGASDLPGFTDEMLNELEVSYYYNSDYPGKCEYWLIEPEVGYPDGVSGLSLTIIVEKLY